MNIKQNIGTEIENRRKELNITQQELAEYLGLSRISIVNLEAGRCSTTFENIYKICCALNITPNELFPEIKPVAKVNRYVEKTITVRKKIKVKKPSLPKAKQ